MSRVYVLWAWGVLLAFVEKYFAADLGMSWLWSLFPKSYLSDGAMNMETEFQHFVDLVMAEM